jgi:hypothetical protein
VAEGGAIKMMKTMILTLSVYQPNPSRDAAMHRLRWFIESGRKYGVPLEDLHVYGIGRRFPGYRTITMDWQLEYLRAHRGEYTHVFFHHGWDAMFAGPWEEVLEKYKQAGSPPSMYATHFGLGNVSEPEKDYPSLYRSSAGMCYGYPQVGGHISEIPFIIDAFTKMLDSHKTRQTGDDCFQLYDAIEQGWFVPVLDTSCGIFQVETLNTEMVEGRLRNTVTGETPCIVHLAGGYSDTVYAKDPAMAEFAKALGVEVE